MTATATATAPALSVAWSDKDVLATVIRARDRALTLYPWFGALAMNLRIRKDTRISTMATNGTHLFYNPLGCAKLTEPNLIFVWAHEILHCGLLHMYRKPSWLDWHEWNVCTDLAINAELIRLAVGTPPTGVLYDAQYGTLAAEQIAHARRKARQQAEDEQAKRDAEQAERDSDQDADDSEQTDDSTSDTDTDTDTEDEQDGSDSDGDNGSEDAEQGEGMDGTPGNEDEQASDGAGAGDESASDGDSGESEAGGDVDSGDGADGQPSDGDGDAGQSEQDAHNPFNPDGSLEAGDDCLPPETADDTDGDGNEQAPTEPRTEADWQVAIDQVSAAMRKAGTMPGGIEQMIAATRRARTDWREILRRFVEAVAPSDYTWRRANKRYVSQGLYLPGTHRESTPPIMVVVDTSGSCSQRELDVFASELTNVLSEAKPRAVHVIYVDTAVNGEVETFTPDDAEVTLTAKGGGGTYFQPAFDWLAEAQDDGTLPEPPACLLYLTDMFAADLDRLTEPEIPVLWAVVPGGSTAPPPFGEVIELDVE